MKRICLHITLIYKHLEFKILLVKNNIIEKYFYENSLNFSNTT